MNMMTAALMSSQGGFLTTGYVDGLAISWVLVCPIALDVEAAEIGGGATALRITTRI